ncbi:thiamine pyrophosphate-binding protein [Campylobacter sp. CLAX-22107-21]|uniref:thiamine pyrophosphate-binding protein n=1 Tax=Campylobacter devanensis TaxID=3161138 RepID=UPI002ECCB26D|nr:thiamine pyrophosphate-binding protein [Campylobacter sp. CLAX-22107-21]
MGYTSEKNIQIIISLLKAHNIKKIVISPGATNITFVASIQDDDWFEKYSSVDERSAAYIACGLAAQSGEPVVISCTGATASRNYYPGLTEAFYRGLPILALTASQVFSHMDQYFDQMLDRTQIAKDIAKHSVSLDVVKDNDDEWDVVNKVNMALLALKSDGGGPVHINYAQVYSKDFSTEKLPDFRVIKKLLVNDEFPKIPHGKIAIYVGSHAKWSNELLCLVDNFCKIYDAVVFGDNTSNYKGEFGCLSQLLVQDSKGNEPFVVPDILNVDLLIHIGYVSGEKSKIKAKKVWRVHEDGKLRNVFKNCNYIFQMSEVEFFKHYQKGNSNSTHYIAECNKLYENLYNKIPELPFSNIWCAMMMSKKMPKNSVLHLGILNTLRSWNFFRIPKDVECYANVGGFGIDGCVSSLVGASIADKNRIFIGIVGDLAFFYDMNVIGNKIVGNNFRLMIINNGEGVEFRNYSHMANVVLKDKADEFVSAKGHYGKKSKTLIRDYAKALGFTYMSAENKDEFLAMYEDFLEDKPKENPIIFEIFINSIDESNALKIMRNI